MKSFLESLGLAILAVFAPIKPMMLAALTLVIVDAITGVWAAHGRKEPITSSGLKRTVGKILLYELALCIAYLVHQYLVGDLLPADKLVAGLIGLVELKSCLENLDSINGTPVFGALLAKITQVQDKTLPPNPPGVS